MTTTMTEYAGDRALLARLMLSQLRRIHGYALSRAEHQAAACQPTPMRDAMRAVEQEARRRGHHLCTSCSAIDMHRETCQHC